jgi:hypothetical protein
MIHFDWQQVAAFGVVAVAGWSVSRRMAGQFAAFRKTSNGETACSGCDSGPSKAKSSPQLITLSAAPLRRVHVPKPHDDD